MLSSAGEVFQISLRCFASDAAGGGRGVWCLLGAGHRYRGGLVERTQPAICSTPALVRQRQMRPDTLPPGRQRAAPRGSELSAPSAVTGCSGSRCCSLTSCHLAESWLAPTVRTQPGLLLPSPILRAGDAVLQPAVPMPTDPRDQPQTLRCSGGAAFLPPPRSCRHSPVASPTFWGLASFFPVLSGLCCCGVAPAQGTWPWPAGGTGRRRELHPKPGAERRAGPARVSRSHCQA